MMASAKRDILTSFLMFIQVILFSCFTTLEVIENVMFIIGSMGIPKYFLILIEMISMFVRSAVVFSK